MADTIGDLIDKLTIVNLRCWHLLAVEGEENIKNKEEDIIQKMLEILSSLKE